MDNNIIDNYMIYETRQEAESFLKKVDKDNQDKNYLKVRELAQPTPALLGILTKLHFGKNISIVKIKQILDKISKYRNDLKRDKVNIQTLLTTAFKTSGLEYIEDRLSLIEIKHETLLFINDLQHSKVRNDLKTKYLDRIANGISSLKNLKNWKVQLEFITKKSAGFGNALDVLNAFEILVRNAVGGFSPQSIIDKIESTPGAVVLYNEDGFVLSQIFTFDSSKFLGSSSWCISRQSNYYHQYSRNNQQLFLWDTNKSPTDIYSTMGTTITTNGGEYTSHLKNDRHFSCNRHIRDLIRNGECKQSLYDTIFSRLTNRPARVQLLSAMFNGNKIDLKAVIKIFDDEYKTSKKETINDFQGLFGLYTLMFSSNKNYTQISEIRGFKTMHNKIKKLSLDMNLDELLHYYNNTIGNSRENRVYSNVVSDIYLVLVKHNEFNNLSVMSKADFYIRCLTGIDLRKVTQLRERNIIPEIINLDLSENQTQSDLSIGGKDSLLSKLVYTHSLDRKTFTFNLNLKDSYKNITIDYGRMIVNTLSVDDRTVKFLSNQLSKQTDNKKLKCNKLIILNKNEDDIPDVEASKIVIGEFKNSKNIMELINKHDIKHVVFNKCTIPNVFSKINFTLDTLTLNKSKLTSVNTKLPSSKKLTLKFSGLDPDNLLVYNLDNLEELEVTSEFLYNLSDSTRKELEDNDVKINKVQGDLFSKMFESLNSKLFSTLYSSFKDKNKINKFFELLLANNVDLKNIEDGDIKYTSSINFNQILKDANVGDSKIVICVNNTEGIKYVVDYSLTKNSWGYNTVKKIKFLDNKLSPDVISGNPRKAVSMSYDLHPDDKALPTIKKIIANTDFLFILDKKETKKNSRRTIKTKREQNKKGSTALMTYKDHSDNLSKRKDEYIKNKYVFNVDGNEKTVNYINTLLPRFIKLSNMFPDNEIDKLLNSVYNHTTLDFEGTTKLNRVGLPSTKSKKIELSEEIITDKVFYLISNEKTTDIAGKYFLRKTANSNRIFPNADKLSKFTSTITEWESVLKKYFKNNPIDIEYMNDLDIFRSRFNDIYNYATSNLPNLHFLYQTDLNLYLSGAKEMSEWNHIYELPWISNKSIVNSIKSKTPEEIKNILNNLITLQTSQFENSIKRLRIYLKM
tara:strand:+ start:4029 stop:7439 length:3411 start_codon:yes stop_codon:yes gene_type:complete